MPLQNNYSDVLVRSFPATDKGKICWCLENKNIAFQMPDSDGLFTVIFWYLGDGYKEEWKYDRLCFDEMKPPKNCIEKDVESGSDND